MHEDSDCVVGCRVVIYCIVQNLCGAGMVNHKKAIKCSGCKNEIKL